MSLGLVLVLVPADDGGVGALHDGLGGPVGPLGAEHEDLAGLLHVLLVHRGLLLRQHVGGQGLGGRHVHGQGHAGGGGGPGGQAHSRPAQGGPA